MHVRVCALVHIKRTETITSRIAELDAVSPTSIPGAAVPRGPQVSLQSHRQSQQHSLPYF